jgi:hypothetical protein
MILLEFGQQRLEDTLPDTAFVPSLQATPTRVTGWKITGRRQPTPGNTRPQDEENSIDDTPRFRRLSSSKLNMAILPWLGNQGFKKFPEIVRQNSRAHEEALRDRSSSDTGSNCAKLLFMV